MKRKIIIAGSVIAVVIIAAAAFFYWQNLRGVWPAVGKPAGNIADMIDQAGESANTTGMPLKIPDGFALHIYARDIRAPRVLAIDPSGRLVVSLTDAGQVVALPDENVDGISDKTVILLSGLARPHGLAFRCEGNAAVQQCFLYVAETGKIVRYDYEQGTPKASNPHTIADLPPGGEHSTRTIAFGPDGRLYVSIGSSCNVCRESDSRRAAIYSMNSDGSDFRQFARGLRNSVFFAWSPQDSRMWATDNGRDLLGDDLPPDEINIVEESKNYGWPICYGKNVHDTSFDHNTYIRNPCMDPFESPSYIDLPAHSAALGMAFVPEGWPSGYSGDLLVAFHGSWNRTQPTGYKIVRIKLDKSGAYEGTEDFITGWLTGSGALGRPVDILAQPGGYAYISDDKAGVIYRLVPADAVSGNKK